MSNAIQLFYIKTLNPLYQLTGKISDRTRNIIIFIIFLLFFIYFACYRSSILNPIVSTPLPTLFDRHLWGSVLLLLLSIFSINQPLHHVEWKGIILIPQLLMGLGIVITGFIHPIGDGYQTFGFMLLFVFPCLYFVWNNRRDYDLLFSLLVYAMIIANLCLFLLLFYYASKGQLLMEGARCAGIMSNSNCFSLIGLELVLGAVYLLITKKPGWPLFVLLCFSAGTGLGIMLIGQMRLAFIIVFVCLLVSILFVAIKKGSVKQTNMKKLLIRCFAGLGIIALTIMLSFVLLNINNRAVDSANAVSQNAAEQTATAKDTSNVFDRFKIKERDANSFSSGRVIRWKLYGKELNLLGNNFDLYDQDKMTGGQAYPFAHNIFFEIGYRCGIPVGILSVLLIIITGIMSLKYLFSKKNKELYLLFPIISAITYAAEALLDCAALPFFQAEALCFYFAMIVFIDKKV